MPKHQFNVTVVVSPQRSSRWKMQHVKQNRRNSYLCYKTCSWGNSENLDFPKKIKKCSTKVHIWSHRQSFGHQCQRYKADVQLPCQIKVASDNFLELVKVNAGFSTLSDRTCENGWPNFPPTKAFPLFADALNATRVQSKDSFFNQMFSQNYQLSQKLLSRKSFPSSWFEKP